MLREALSELGRALFCKGLVRKMKMGNFYFINDDYFIDFPDNKLMANRETSSGTVHDRPCFYAIYEEKTSIYWLIPISSQIEKFKSIYQKKIQRYGICDTIVFGKVLGHEKAFLIQNMCPIIPRYIKNEYIDSKSGLPVKIEGVFERKIVKKAKKVLALQRKGVKLIFPDVLKIEQELIKLITV